MKLLKLEPKYTNFCTDPQLRKYSRIDVVFGANTGLIYDLKPLGNHPSMTKEIIDFYDSMKVLMNHHDEVNFNVTVQTDGELYRLNKNMINGTIKILPQQLDGDLPVNQSRGLNRKHFEWIRESLSKYADKINYGKDQEVIDTHAQDLLELKKTFKTLLNTATMFNLGNYKIPCENLVEDSYIVINDSVDVFNKEYQKFVIELSTLKELGYWIPEQLGGFIDFDIVKKERNKNLFE